MSEGDVVRVLDTGQLALVESAADFHPSEVRSVGRIEVGKSRKDGGSDNRKAVCYMTRGLEEPIRVDVITREGRNGCEETRKGEIRKMAFEQLVAMEEGRGTRW